MNSLQREWTPGRVIAWVILLTMIVVTLLPLWVVLKTGLMHATDVYTGSTELLPPNPTLLNFKKVLGLVSTEEALSLGGSGAQINFLRALGNSMLFTSIIVVLQTTFSAMASYAFARLRFPGRQVIFACLWRP